MTFKGFVALWQHRARKYAYILHEWVFAQFEILRFWWLKKRLGSQRPLVAIVRTEHLGDIVAAEPIARQVRKRHPTAHLVWIVKPAFASIVRPNPTLDEVWEQPTVLRRKIICESGVFDFLYNLEFWQSNVDKVSGWVHHNSVAERNNVSIYNYLMGQNLLTAFQRAADLPIEDDTPQVYLSDQEREVVDALGLPDKFVVIHCSSNYPAKDWSVEKWQKLTKHLINKGFLVIEIGLQSQNHLIDDQYINLCGSLSLLETAEVIRRAAYFIGIDSGPAHFANAVGTYGILLFGKLDFFDTYQTYSGKYANGHRATIIRQPDRTCAEMDYDWVVEKIDALIFQSFSVSKT